MSLYLGVARTQNRASQIMNDVRNEGGSYKVKGGRGYNTNAGLDFHQDSCDVVGLLCRRTSRTRRHQQGDEFDRRARRDRPHAARSAAGVEANRSFTATRARKTRRSPPFYSCPILGSDDAPFCMRTNRKNSDAAQRDFEEAPRLTPEQTEALDLLDQLLPGPAFLLFDGVGAR